MKCNYNYVIIINTNATRAHFFKLNQNVINKVIYLKIKFLNWKTSEYTTKKFHVQTLYQK